MAAFKHEVVAHRRTGKERLHEYATDEPLAPGAVLFLEGRYWLVERVEPQGGGLPVRAFAKPARYRIRLHPEGREETGAFRRFRPDAPRHGHSFTTREDGHLISWEVVDEQLAFDDEGEPYLDLRAERDYGEAAGDLPNHELEHALAIRQATVPEGAAALFTRAAAEGLSLELVALEPGEEPDWPAAESYIKSLILEEIEDDLIELCGVDPDRDPRDTWLGRVKERLLSDLEHFRADLEGEGEEIEEWEFEGGRVFASVGNHDDEADPDKGHGWMCRLVDVSALTAAGFERVRKAELEIAG
jgi:hypothetical protein